MEIISKLESTRDRTLQYFELDEDQLTLTYAFGKWSVRYLLHHLADSEAVLSDRIRRIITEPRQVIWAYNQDAWAAGLNYAAMPLDLSRRIYEATRGATIYLADQ